jgi:hypothetical protein
MAYYPSTSSGELTASAAIKALPCQLASVTVTPGSATTTVIIYDNASAASGTKLLSITMAANGSTQTFSLNYPKVANNGLYCSISGTGASANVDYILS